VRAYPLSPPLPDGTVGAGFTACVYIFSNRSRTVNWKKEFFEHALFMTEERGLDPGGFIAQLVDLVDSKLIDLDFAARSIKT
jgi:hypothetical protein